MLAPEVETRPWEDQLAHDDAAYREQIAYLLRPLAVLPREARRRRHPRRRRGRRPGRIARPAADREAGAARRRARPRTRSARTCARARRDRPHLLDERHDRHAELHPADGGRPRQLDHGLGAQLRRVGRGARPAHRLDLQRRAVRRPARRSRRSSASASATSRSAPATPSGSCAPSSCSARGGRAHAVLRRPPARWAAQRDIDLRASSVRARARRGRARRRRAGVPRRARGGLGRAGDRGHGHRRHRRLAVGRVRGPRTACTSARAASSTPS